MTRAAMWLLLAVVAGAAAVLSFDSLRALAVLCGYPDVLAPLFPVTVDAGAAAACLAWLGGQSAATRVGRMLTWVLLFASVGMNAIVHALEAYAARPAWWLIVIVSAIPPATLGAVTHLAVLVGRPGAGTADISSLDVGSTEVDEGTQNLRTSLPPDIGRRRLAAELGVSEYRARQMLAERNGADR